MNVTDLHVLGVELKPKTYHLEEELLVDKSFGYSG